MSDDLPELVPLESVETQPREPLDLSRWRDERTDQCLQKIKALREVWDRGVALERAGNFLSSLEMELAYAQANLAAAINAAVAQQWLTVTDGFVIAPTPGMAWAASPFWANKVASINIRINAVRDYAARLGHTFTI
jgi:hypothetical protein